MARLCEPRSGDLWEVNGRLLLKVCSCENEFVWFSTVVDEDGKLVLYPEKRDMQVCRQADLGDKLEDIIPPQADLRAVICHRPLVVYPERRVRRSIERKL
jgi:hypothetical protein